jgi:prepilin-type processing-associated H-X9-DG protein
MKAGKPDQMRCPTNVIRGTEKLNDANGDKNTSNGNRLAANPDPSKYSVSDLYLFDGTNVIPKKSGSNMYIATQTMVNELGMNTNYSCSWHMSRSGVKYVSVGTSASDAVLHVLGAATVYPNNYAGTGTVSISGFKEVNNTTGPLTQRMIEVSDVPAGNIPMLGDTAAGDIDEAVLVTTINRELVAGSRLGEAANDGPAFWNNTAGKVNLITVTDVASQYIPLGFPTVGQAVVEATFAPNTGTSGVLQGELILQDTRDWQAVHGGRANILMADGSVKELVDLNGDTFFNPGFAATGGTSNTDGYIDNVCEINAFEVYTGTILNFKALTKTKFE